MFHQVDDVLAEDAEKAQSLEEVIAELERLQVSEAAKDRQLAESQSRLQVKEIASVGKQTTVVCLAKTCTPKPCWSGKLHPNISNSHVVAAQQDFCSCALKLPITYQLSVHLNSMHSCCSVSFHVDVTCLLILQTWSAANAGVGVSQVR